MTKRDVAVWFCKVSAVMGMATGAFNLIITLIRLSGTIGSGSFGVNGGVPHLLLYLFVGLFARGIGTELAAEGDHGEPITSANGLNQLALRCVGLHLFLLGVLATANFTLFVACYYFLPSRFALGAGGYLSLLLPGTIAGVVQATCGFILAFGPRIRAALHSR
jgi:hypothetical protein